MFDRAIQDESRRRDGSCPQAARRPRRAVIESLEQRRLLSATLTTLASFTSDNGGGDGPFAGLVLSGGALYGTTMAQGADADGTVFSVPVGGGTPTTLATFDGTNGAGPSASLILAGGTLFGTTNSGGADGDGTVFSLPVGGGTPISLATFDGDNGAAPSGSLVLSGSTLYGAASQGAGPDTYGTVFSIPVVGGTPTTLGTFDDTDGAYPTGVTLSNGTLYGTTYQGGADEDGTVFSLPVGGGTPATLATFDGANGQYPLTGLIASGGTLYGTTYMGGAESDGTVFSVPIGGGTPATLATFDGANGDNPGGLLLFGSNLYGTTESGGTYGAGLVFSVPTSGGTGGTPATLVSFDPMGTDPILPSIVTSLVPDTAGNLYGTTVYGGVDGVGGTVFEVSPAPTVVSVTPQDDAGNGVAAGSAAKGQRSMETQIAVVFGEPVNLTSGAFTLNLVNNDGGGTNNGAADSPLTGVLGTPTNPSGDGETWIIPILSGGTVSDPSSALNGSSTSYALNGTHGGISGASLDNGVYDLGVTAADVTATGGGPAMAANYTSAAWHRLYGDVDNARRVFNVEYSAFLAAYTSTYASNGAANYNQDLDADGDGRVFNTDYSAFLADFGSTRVYTEPQS
jgi:uncharacterized repeat protein (TIGR03803 family)